MRDTFDNTTADGNLMDIDLKVNALGFIADYRNLEIDAGPKQQHIYFLPEDLLDITNKGGFKASVHPFLLQSDS